MLVITRFRVLEEDESSFAVALTGVRDALAAAPGFGWAETGRNLDDPSLWALVTGWSDVGSYRRALSSYDVKLAFGALHQKVLEEPSAYEPVTGDLNRNVPR
ncbi:MAG: antibiotic biosynthesis monooxygenase family protein [Marmoricola sp.]